MSTRFADHLLTGDHASRPAANTVPDGTLYSCTDHSLIYQSDGAAWTTWATVGAGSGVATDAIWDAKGDLAGGTGANTAARLPVGTNGQVLTADSGETTGLKWAAGGAGGGSYTLIEAHDFGSAATSHTFSGLNGDTDAVYVLIYRIIQGAAAVVNITVEPNSLATNQQSYYNVFGSATGTGNTTTLRIINFGGAIGDVAGGQLWLQAKTGFYRQIRGESLQSDSSTTNNYAVDYAAVWRETATNITSLRLIADQANGIGAGSYARLYKILPT